MMSNRHKRLARGFLLPGVLALLSFPVFDLPTKAQTRPYDTLMLMNQDVMSSVIPVDSVPALKLRADADIRAKKLDDAIYLYRRIVLATPHDLGAAMTMADLYAWKGDYDHAAALYRDIIERDSLNISGVKGLARVMRWATRYSEAERYYTIALRAEPDDLEALIGLAITFAQQRNFETALKFVDQAAQKSPRNPEVFRIRGDILAWGNHFNEAEGNYLEALHLDPGSTEVYRSLGDLYKWAGKHSRAVDALKKARQFEPNNPDLLLALADAYIDAGMARQAEETAKALFALDPNNTRAYTILRKLDARNIIDYSLFLNAYAKPAFLLVSNIVIGIYFWKRKDRLKRRTHRMMGIVYQIWPVLAVLWLCMFLIARVTGLWGTDLLTEIAEFATLVVWVIAFLSLILVTRSQERGNGKTILAIGAHPDDIELGCGGTLARYKEMGYRVFGIVITSGECGNPYTNDHIDRRSEAEAGAATLGLDGIWVYQFKDSALSGQLNEVKDVLEAKIHQIGAEVIITQSPHDVHQDHKAVFEATRIAARGTKTLLCYEDVSTEAHFIPNCYIDITEYIEDKINAVQAHRTQKGKPYMNPENISGRAAHRGLQTGVKYAEAFLIYRGFDLWISS